MGLDTGSAMRFRNRKTHERTTEMTCRKGISAFCILVIFLPICIAGLTGCQQRPTNRIFTFFFPEEKPPEKTETFPQSPKRMPPPIEKSEFREQSYLLVTHKPYIERKCVECHEGASAFTTSIFGRNWDGIFREGGGKPGPLTLPIKKLCVKCHTDLAPKWAKERGLYLHKTAIEGECIKCHAPHQGYHPYRLVADKDQLCGICHNENEKIGIPKCVKEMQVTGPCLSCHNAHLGTSKALLKKDYEELKHTVTTKQAAPGENLSPVDTEKTE